MDKVYVVEGKFGTLRFTSKDNECFFIGKDIAKMLNYDNPQKAIADFVDDEDKKYIILKDQVDREENIVVINQFGVFNLLHCSPYKLKGDMAFVKDFKNWIIHNVIPMFKDTFSLNLSNEDVVALKIINSESKQERAEYIANYRDLILKNNAQPFLRKQEDVGLPKKRTYRKRGEPNPIAVSEVTKILELRKGQITNWGLLNGYLEIKNNHYKVTNNGDKYFKVFVNDNGSGGTLGVTDEGLKFVEENINTIADSSTRLSRKDCGLNG